MRYLAQTLSALAACCVTVSSATADPLPCQGRYSAQSGNVTLSADGMVYLDPRNRREGAVDLTYEGATGLQSRERGCGCRSHAQQSLTGPER